MLFIFQVKKTAEDGEHIGVEFGEMSKKVAMQDALSQTTVYSEDKITLHSGKHPMSLAN